MIKNLYLGLLFILSITTTNSQKDTLKIFSEISFLVLKLEKKVSFTLGYVNSRAAENNFSLERYGLRLYYQPFDAFNLSVSSEYEENPNKTQYVAVKNFKGSPRYITGNIDQHTLSTSIRFNYSLNPNLSIQYYGPSFISRGTYTDFNYVNKPIAENLNERVTMFSNEHISSTDIGAIYLIDEDIDSVVDYEIENPDFSFGQFRSILVLRWEYIPGSEVFWFGRKVL